MLIPEVVGFELTGAMLEGTTGTDLVLKVVELLRTRGVVGKFVEFYGAGLDYFAPRGPRNNCQYGSRVWCNLRLFSD